MDNNMQATTLKDVSIASGVSISTVSKIFQGQTEKFKPETVRKVMDAAKELNYIPNAMARGMVTGGRSGVIGFFIPNILNPFFVELANELELRLVEKGYILSLCLYNDNVQLMKKYINFLLENRATGAIFGPAPLPHCEEEIEKARRHLAMISIQCDLPDIDRIDINNEQASYEIVSHLIRLGHRKISFVGYQYNMSVNGDRLKGYKRALTENNIPIKEEYILSTRHSDEYTRILTRELMSLPDPPSAIQCCNEFTAFSVIRELNSMNIKVPNDVSITAIDNIPISRVINPPLTTISQPIDKMAQTAITLFLDRIDNNYHGKARSIVLPHDLIIRSSAIPYTKS
jgi:DNA-binding LacI/PurR family transcriptional regulator